MPSEKKENKKENEKKVSIFGKLKDYGLEAMEGIRNNLDSLSDNSKKIFSGALSLFKQKQEIAVSSGDEQPLLTMKRLGELEEGETVLVDKFNVYSELDLIKKVEFLLGEYENSTNFGGKFFEKSKKLKIKLDRATNLSTFDNELLDGDIVEGNNVLAMKLVENFKTEIADYLSRDKHGRRMSKEIAEDFVDTRFKQIEKEVAKANFSVLINKENNNKIRLISDNFVFGYARINNTIINSRKEIKNNKRKLIDRDDGLADENRTIIDLVSTEIERRSQGRFDGNDWYRVGNIKAKNALDLLETKLKSGEFNHLSKNAQQWIVGSLKNFSPVKDETFEEYIERRLMKGGNLAFVYNQIIDAIKLINKNKNQNTLGREIIGSVKAKSVLDKMRHYKSLRNDVKIGYILDNNIKPRNNESLRRYFYRLSANNRGYLNEDGLVDEINILQEDDIQALVNILTEFMPSLYRFSSLSRRKKRVFTAKEVPYYDKIRSTRKEELLGKQKDRGANQ
jgi:hypothetical protein